MIERIISSKNDSFKSYLIKTFEMRELIYIIFLRDLKLQYRKSKIGWLWAIIYPLVYGIIFSFVFKVKSINGLGEVDYFTYIICGLVPWMFISGMILQSANLFSNFGNIVQKVYFPKLILVIAQCLNRLVDFCFSILILLIFLLITNRLNVNHLYKISFYLPILFLSGIGFGSFSAYLGIKSKDFRIGIGFLIQLLLFVSGVLYVEAIEKSNFQVIRILNSLNPFVWLIRFFRNCIYLEVEINKALILNLISILIISLLGIYSVYKFDRNIAESV